MEGDEIHLIHPSRLTGKGQISPAEVTGAKVKVIQERGGSVTTHSALAEHEQLLILQQLLHTLAQL